MRLHWITEVGMFFQRQGPVWDCLRDLEANLAEATIDYIVVGALAVNAHGHRRTTTDVDICLTEEGLKQFQERLVGQKYGRVSGRPRRFSDLKNDVTVDILVAGRIAGRRSRQQEVKFPDPSEAQIHDDLPTVSLARLIELKLVTWRLQDWADVISLIRVHDLDEGFAEQLDPVARSGYLQCCDERVEEDRYEEEESGF